MKDRGMQRSLVTGGSGFIGSHLVDVLVARGHAVRIFDCKPPTMLPPGVEFARGTILDAAAVQHAMQGTDLVFHLAGIAHLWTDDARAFDDINWRGTEMVLSAAARCGIRRIVHCSSETVLMPRRGGAATVDETATLGLADMAGPYARSKYRAEQAAVAAARDGLPVVVVNPTIPLGGGDRGLTPPTALIAHLLLRPPPLLLDCMLNLVDVRDVATGMLQASERGRSGDRYVLGGENVRLLALAERLTRLSGRPGRCLTLPAPLAFAAGHVSEWIATHITGTRPLATVEGVELALRSAPLASDKARRELAYRPGPIDAGLAEAVAFVLRSQRHAGSHGALAKVRRETEAA
jgi:dihydroflavonol-4-reductase